MSVIFVDTSWPVNTRTQRFYDTISAADADCNIVGWNRTHSNVNSTDNEFVYNKVAAYGNKLKKLFGILGFTAFIKKSIKASNSDIVFCSHWDSLLCVSLIRIFFRLNYIIIYDCLDMPYSSNKVLNFFLKNTEKLCLNFVTHTVFASRFFPEKYNITPSNYTVFENYPKMIPPNEITQSKMKFPTLSYNDVKIISWVGVLRYRDTFTNLINAVKGMDNYILFIFGDGPELDYFLNYVSENKLGNKVYFFGRFSSTDLNSIYKTSDLVWAAYPSENENVRYAISNKYFECNLFSVVPIFSENTKIGSELIEKNSTVILVDEYSIEKIKYAIIKYGEREFIKYEPDIFWENKEPEIIEMITAFYKE